MTVTMSLPWLLLLVVGSSAWVLVVGLAAVWDVTRPTPPPVPLRVTVTVAAPQTPAPWPVMLLPRVIDSEWRATMAAHTRDLDAISAEADQLAARWAGQP